MSPRPEAEKPKPAGRRARAASPEATPHVTPDDEGEGPVLFVSYSHTDAALVQDAERHLRNVADTCGFQLFVDERGIKPGETWLPRIESALRRARAAVVFLSNHYLDTERFASKELEAILARFRLGKLTPFVVPVDDVDPYLPDDFEELFHIQWALPKDRPLGRLTPQEREGAFRKLNEVIGRQLEGSPDGEDDPRTFEEFAKSEVRRTLDRKYEIQGCLGSGQSSVVFRARDTALGRDVALKVLVHARYESDLAQEFVERARLAAGLRHSNIVQILTSQLDSSPYYLVMECVEGSNFEKVGKKRGVLEARLALDYFQQVASALACIHDRGLVHGAIRPSNVLFDPSAADGRAVLSVHWLRGVRRRSQRGLTLEELTYLTPEQYEGAEPDTRSDQHQLGQLLCELLTGEPPARVLTLKDFEKKQASFASPVPPSVEAVRVGHRPRFREALGRMMSRDPAARFPSIAEAMRAIREATAGQTGDWTLQLARDSFDRCVAAPDFFPSIYRELFALRPDLEGLFHRTDLERQYVRLRVALLALFEVSEGAAAVHRTIEDYGRQHAEMAIRPEDYDSFLEAVCRAARGAEGATWSPVLESAWRAALEPGIERMKRHAARRTPPPG